MDYDEVRNVARTYRESKMFDIAIEKFKEAAALDDDNWLCNWGLGLAYADHKQWSLAIETLEAVIESVECESSLPHSYALRNSIKIGCSLRYHSRESQKR